MRQGHIIRYVDFYRFRINYFRKVVITLEWGITFEEPYVLPEKAARKVAYVSKKELEAAIDAYVRDQAAVQAEAAGTAAAPAADDPQNDKNDAEQPKPVDLRTDTEKERGYGVF